MEALQAVRLSTNIASFIASATTTLLAGHNIAQKLVESKDVSTGLHEDIATLSKTLQERLNQAKFQPPDGATLLTAEDSIFQRLSNHCGKLARDILTDLEQLKLNRYDADGKRLSGMDSTAFKHTESEEFKRLLKTMRKDLNEDLAKSQWASVSRLVLELGAKNSRIDANRTEDIEQLKNDINTCFEELKLWEDDDELAAATWSRLLTAVQEAMNYSGEQTVLSDLQFWTMDGRQESIPKEHQNTLEWILAEDQRQNSSQPAVNFAEWLRNDEPLYWVSGKPGSGKSTLMKFVAASPKTMDGLKGWAGDSTVITASFYFWSSARDPLQKSDAGLMRSILFQILRQCPDFIQHGFPEQWEGGQFRGFPPGSEHSDPTATELLAAYQRISDLLSRAKVKFCFFIDGLDEFEGRPSDIIRLIELLSKTPNLKACISSRPWEAFEASFGGGNPWKLCVHELTSNDMAIYVRDLLENDSRFLNMKRRESKGETGSLIRSIVQAAEGVFLWVFLVARSLLDGLSDSDRISDLHQRLEAIPNDLEDYFESLLLDIDESLRGRTAYTFMITIQAIEKLPLMCYWIIDEEPRGSLLNNEEGRMSRATATERLEDMSNKLETHCKGLLKASNTERIRSSKLQEHQWLFEFRVDFLHRTVADFLRTADMDQLLNRWISKHFNADLEICKSCLATLKATPSTKMIFAEPSRATSLLHLFLSHARLLVGTSLDESRFKLLAELVPILKLHAEAVEDIKGLILGPGNYWAYNSSVNFAILYLIVSYGHGDFVGLQLDRGRFQFEEPPSGLLSACLSWDPRVRRGKLMLDLDTIQLLLHRGLDPNMRWGDRNFSFWQQLLTMTYSRHLRGAVTQVDCDAIRCAVEHGADQQAQVEVFSGRRMGSAKATDILTKVLSREQYLALTNRTAL